MPNREELIEALAQMDPASFEDVVNSAYRKSCDFDDAWQDPPGDGATPEQFARWIATRHLASDAALERAVYLPTGAPEGEIRLLEVNRLLNPPECDLIEPLDFTPDSDPRFRVFVADVTMDQWERARQGTHPGLPAGWVIPGYIMVTRG